MQWEHMGVVVCIHTPSILNLIGLHANALLFSANEEVSCCVFHFDVKLRFCERRWCYHTITERNIFSTLWCRVDALKANSFVFVRMFTWWEDDDSQFSLTCFFRRRFTRWIHLELIAHLACWTPLLLLNGVKFFMRNDEFLFQIGMHHSVYGFFDNVTLSIWVSICSNKYVSCHLNFTRFEAHVRYSICTNHDTVCRTSYGVRLKMQCTRKAYTFVGHNKSLINILLAKIRHHSFLFCTHHLGPKILWELATCQGFNLLKLIKLTLCIIVINVAWNLICFGSRVIPNINYYLSFNCS